ncbi:putative transposase [Bacillus mycoides NBRC 101238 = DSM 11821]|nr:putative transposase [Bacillus mycoides NBRC 101238 = DSM 11821]
MPVGIQTRQHKYLNNIVEQDHRFIKKRIRSMLGFKSYQTAVSILSGVEAIIWLKKNKLIYGIRLSKIRIVLSISCLD